MSVRNGSPTSQPDAGPVAAFAWLLVLVGVVLFIAIGTVFLGAAWLRLLVDAAAAGWDWAGG